MYIKETDKTTGRYVQRLVPVTVRYERLMTLLNSDDSDRMKRYKEKLFGTETEVISGDRYNLHTMLKDSQIPIYIWDKMDIHQQESTRAHYHLAGIVALLRRHDELQKEAMKKLEDKAKKK